MATMGKGRNVFYVQDDDGNDLGLFPITSAIPEDEARANAMAFRDALEAEFGQARAAKTETKGET